MNIARYTTLDILPSALRYKQQTLIVLTNESISKHNVIVNDMLGNCFLSAM